MSSSNELFERRSVVKGIDTGLAECNYIKYAAYRTAAKLQLIQKALHMNKISLKVISNVFERHQLHQTENTLQLDPRELESVLFDIYFTVQNGSDGVVDINHTAQLMIAFLLNVYDTEMKNVIQVLSVKVSLTLLCQSKPREKYHYLFHQLADHNKCLSRKKMQVLLKKMATLTEYISEGLSFGFELIPGTIESCFNFKIGTLGISEENFTAWLMQDPQMLIWLSTFYRLQISESVTHNVKCAICKIYPMTGLRYKCLRCLSIDMCQACFFNGKFNKNHKLSHPVQEYCHPMTSQQSAKAFLITLRNMLYKKNSKLQYLPALRVDSGGIEALGQSSMLLDEIEISSRTVVIGSRRSLHKFPFNELQNIILQLEGESNKLIPQIDELCSRMTNASTSYCQSQLITCLKRHKYQVESQVRQLKLLRQFLMSSKKLNGNALLASTPVERILTKSSKNAINKDLENLSPIERSRNRRTGRDENSDKKLIWDDYDFDTYWEEMKSTKCSDGIFETSPESRRASFIWQANNGGGISEICPSTWLGGKTLRGSDTYSKEGFTWLQEDVYEEKSNEEQIAEENKGTLQELQSDLKQILEKLEELSNLNLTCHIQNGGTASKGKKVEIQAAVEVDCLLVNLINGIEKLIAV